MILEHAAAIVVVSETVPVWKPVYEALSPGAHLAAISLHGKSYHRMAVGIEDAGFEIRDQLVWIGEDRIVPIALARVPLSDETVATNVLKWGTGGINVDGCRVNPGSFVPGGGNGKQNYKYGDSAHYSSDREKVEPHTNGRWPANVILTKAAGARLDEQSGILHTHAGTSPTGKPKKSTGIYGALRHSSYVTHSSSGGASRFFKCCDTLDELIGYLTAMILPSGGVLLTTI